MRSTAGRDKEARVDPQERPTMSAPSLRSLQEELDALRKENQQLRAQEAERQRAEADLRFIMAGARCLLWNCDLLLDAENHLNWKLHYPDPQAAQRFLPLEMVPGQPYEDALWRSRLPEDRQRTDAFAYQEVLNGRSYSQEYRCRRVDGQIRWIAEEVYIETVGPKRWRAVGVCTDITERKQAEEALRNSEKYYRTLIDNLPAIVSRVSPDLVYLYVSPAIQTVTGQPPERFIGKPVGVSDASKSTRKWLSAVRRVFASGLGEDFEFIYQTPQGERTYQMRVVPELVDGHVISVLSISQDITEHKRAEEELEKHARDLARSNADLEQFAYVTSHDMQEPLRMVTSYTQLLKKRYHDRLDTDADAYIGYVVEGVDRMQQLIKDLLAYSRVGRGEELQPTDCQAILGRTLRTLDLTITDTGAHITHDPLPTVQADATQLSQLFQNLIGNALKFRSDRPPQIHIGAERQGKEWLFAIKDNGIGIDPQYAERIFIIFQRLHTRTEYPGTGIGLAICKKIIERHGGRIWMESVPGEGSAFFFTLPA